jgi:hypothetical protein
MRGNKMHSESFAQAGQTVVLSAGPYEGQSFTIEDWWDLLTGGSWMDADGNPVAIQYAIQGLMYNIPYDDEVLYGKIDGLDFLVHTKWL